MRRACRLVLWYLATMLESLDLRGVEHPEERQYSKPQKHVVGQEEKGHPA